MLKSLMGAARINLVSERELVDMAQSLEWRRVDDSTLVRVEVDEDVKGVTDLM